MSWKAESKIPTYLYIHYSGSLREYVCNIIKGDAPEHDDLWQNFIDKTADLKKPKNFAQAEEVLEELREFYIINWKLDKDASDYNLHTFHIQPSDNILLLNMKLFKVLNPTASSSKYPKFMLHLWCYQHVFLTPNFIDNLKNILSVNKSDNLELLPKWFPLIPFARGENAAQIEDAEDPFKTLEKHHHKGYFETLSKEERLRSLVKMKTILGSVDPIHNDDPVIFNRTVKVPNAKRNLYQTLLSYQPIDDTIYGMNPNNKGYQYEDSNFKELEEEDQPLNKDSKFLRNLTRLEDNSAFPDINYISGNILQMYFSCFDKPNPSTIDIQKLFDAFDELLDKNLVFVKIWSDNTKRSYIRYMGTMLLVWFLRKILRSDG